MRWSAPRGRVRLDTAHAHAYPRADEAPVGAEPPTVPFAVYLGDAESGRMRTVVFDLDAHHGDDAAVGQVWADADAILALLEQADLDHYVSSSGPSGGVHVWVPVSGEEGLDVLTARRIGRAARRLLPSLDTSCLHPEGLVRPPGAPHRSGGRAELIHPADPADALSVVDTEANTPEAFGRLLVLLGGGEHQEHGADNGAGTGRVDAEAVRLRGRRTAMPDAVRRLLDTPPADGDASAHLARILPRLALARWGAADVAALAAAEPQAPGLEHLRTRRSPAGGRRPRAAAEQDRLLAAQWARAVHFAAGLPERAAEQQDWSGVCGLVEALQAATADGARWSAQAGLADRLVLQYIALQALRSGQVELDIDVRRAALGTGVGRSTAHRALGRLCADGRLVRVEAGAGRSAARYRLTHPDHWPAKPQPTRDGTQGNPPPGVPGPMRAVPSPAPAPRGRAALLEALTARLSRAAADVWAVSGRPGGPRGLGRAAEAVHYALHTADNQGLYGVDLIRDISARTTLAPARVAALLDTLARHRLTRTGPGPSAVVERGELDAAAMRLGTAGITAARARRYAAEREAYAAWCSELERLRAPAALRPRRTGPAYPRTPTGRPDHAAARLRAAA